MELLSENIFPIDTRLRLDHFEVPQTEPNRVHFPRQELSLCDRHVQLLEELMVVLLMS